MILDYDNIKLHWESWAKQYGSSLRATTKAPTAKSLEIDALVRTFNLIRDKNPAIKSVLEVGTGNAENILHLAEIFPQINFMGIDYIAAMIDIAKARQIEHGIPEERMRLLQGDIMNLPSELDKTYDIVFTVRCIINLNSDKDQKKALTSLCKLLTSNHHLVMIENSLTTFANQNHARELIELAPRKVVEFNHFFNEKIILNHLNTECDMELVNIEDFCSLHDLMLYVLVPAINSGIVDYDHPLVHAATTLSMELSSENQSCFGDFGQNRLYVFRKR